MVVVMNESKVENLVRERFQKLGWRSFVSKSKQVNVICLWEKQTNKTADQFSSEGAKHRQRRKAVWHRL